MRETSGMGGGTKRWFEDVIGGRRALPVWMQVAFVPIAVLVVVRAATERGLAVGAVAALTYGYIAIPNSVTRKWTVRRSDFGNRLLSLLFITSLYFIALSSFWSRSSAVCAAAALLGGVTLTGLALVLGRRLAA